MNWQNKPWADLSPFERAMVQRALKQRYLKEVERERRT